MISIENNLYSHTCTSTKMVQWSNKNLKEDEDDNKHYVSLRRSRKGTNLNNPVEFNKTPTEQSIIRRFLVLPTGGCCDTEYVLSRKDKSKKHMSTKKSAQNIDSTLCPQSITINIGTSMPFHLNPSLPGYHPTIYPPNATTNQKVISEEWLEPEEQDKSSLQEKVTPSLLPPQEQVVSSLLPLQQQVIPSLLPPQEQVTPFLMSPRERVTPYLLSPQERVTPSLVSPQEQVVPSLLPPQEQVIPSLLPSQEQVTPFLMSSRERVTPSLLSPQEQVTPFIISPREKVTPSLLSPQERVTPSLLHLQVTPRQHYESNTTFASSPSREQRIINLDTPQQNCYGDNLTYVTKQEVLPKISPFKFFFSCFGCKRKLNEEVYLPSIMTRNEQSQFQHRNEQPLFQHRNEQPLFQHRNEQPLFQHRNEQPIFQHINEQESFRHINEQQNHNIIPYSTYPIVYSRVLNRDFSCLNSVPSRLSTITESEISSQQLTQDSEPQNKKNI